jgi:hypothetical protein
MQACSTAVQGGNEADGVIGLQLVVDAAAQFPVRVVYQHQDLQERARACQFAR